LLILWDTAREKQSELVEKLKLRKRALMQQLLTGKKRLPGFCGEWKRIKAGDIFMSSSVRGKRSEVLLSATQEHGVIPRDQLEGRVTMPTGNLESFKLVEVGDFVISLRSFQGGIEYSEHRGIVSPAYTVLKPVKEIDKSFYRFYFKSADFIGHLAIAVIGIRDGKQISYEDFCFVKIPYPRIEEQKAISAILIQAEKEIELAKEKLANLQSQKRGLMQQLLTGKKRLL
jgi:type I restriction enzyme S subunit